MLTHARFKGVKSTMMTRQEIEAAMLEYREEKSKNIIKIWIVSTTVSVMLVSFIIIFDLHRNWEVLTPLSLLLSLCVCAWYFNRNIHKDLGLLCSSCETLSLIHI